MFKTLHRAYDRATAFPIAKSTFLRAIFLKCDNRDIIFVSPTHHLKTIIPHLSLALPYHRKPYPMGGSRGGTGGPEPPEKSIRYRVWRDRGSGHPPPLKKGFCSNTGPNTLPNSLKNHKASKPTFNVGPPSARLRNAI